MEARQGRASKVLRSTHECYSWRVEQASGGFFHHLSAAVLALSGLGNMVARGFCTDGCGDVGHAVDDDQLADA